MEGNAWSTFLVLTCETNIFPAGSFRLLPLWAPLIKQELWENYFCACFSVQLLHISCCVQETPGIYIAEHMTSWAWTSRMESHNKKKEISNMSDVSQTPEDNRPWAIVWKETISLSTKGKWSRRYKEFFLHLNEMSLQIAWEIKLESRPAFVALLSHFSRVRLCATP